MRFLALLLGLGIAGVAEAHPMSRDQWSLRTAVQLVADKLDAVVVLEVPFDVVAKALKPGLDAARAQGQAAPAAADAVIQGYAKQHFDTLARHLTLTVDGKPVPGTWRPSANRLNGKGAVEGGFFLYIVEFAPAGTPKLDDDVTLVVDDKAYPDAPMVYSAMVVAGTGWKVVSNSAAKLLPTRPYDLNAPDFWVSDPSLRRVEARFQRTP